jgi:L-threonylcarbamoyladenylate synthase
VITVARQTWDLLDLPTGRRSDGVASTDAAAIAAAAQHLQSGGLVASDRDGLGADASSDVAGAKFLPPDRPADHPLIVHVASAASSQLRQRRTSFRPTPDGFWPDL